MSAEPSFKLSQSVLALPFGESQHGLNSGITKFAEFASRGKSARTSH
jgi:hypothetical protein